MFEHEKGLQSYKAQSHSKGSKSLFTSRTIIYKDNDKEKNNIIGITFRMIFFQLMKNKNITSQSDSTPPLKSFSI